MLRKSIGLSLFLLFLFTMSGPVFAEPDDYTGLLIHSNTSDGSQAFSDSSNSSHTITANGDVRHSETQKVFGSSSIYFDGTSDYLQLADHQDWRFDDGDFTIDFWYNPSRYHNTFEGIFRFGDNMDLYLNRCRTGLRGGMFEIKINGNINTTSYRPDHLGIWKHIAVVRSQDEIMLFVNGQLTDTFQLASGEKILPPSGNPVNLYIGMDENGHYPFLGHLDEIRISKGIARWTADFTPPTAPYEDAMSDTAISLVPDTPSPTIGDILCVDVNIDGSNGLYSSAFDLTFDPAALQYQNATEGDFLNSDGGATFFNASLLNNNPANGTLVMGVSRVADIGVVSGSGTIARACFSVIGGSGGNTSVGIDNGYFEGAEQGTGIEVVEGSDPVIPVGIGVPRNLSVTDPGTLDRLDLVWDTAADASGYEIYRATTSGGSFELLGTTSSAYYQDSDCTLTGVNYFYKIKAVSSIGSSTGEFSEEASGAITGLTGDINKDNRVDGRDLTILARAFNTIAGSPDYNCQANLDRAGGIDGDDLVILTTNFGSKR
ncbi:MAG: LamG-like jellyroll fold domain-containing protein [Desulfobacter sp.]